MKIAVWSIAIVAALLALYAVKGRAWLKAKPWAKPFFDWIEPIEILLWKKSETILFARLKMVSGILLTLLTQLGTIDLTPLMPIVPEKYQAVVQVAVQMLPFTLTIVGWMDERLRNCTTKPLELVEVPEAKPVPPEVAAAVAQAEAVKEVAVAVVQDAKEKGAVP
jgi:hypothetical protein